MAQATTWFSFWLLLLTLSSCAFLFGLKEPKTESVAGIYKYYHKAGIDTSLLLFIKPNYIDTLRLLSHKDMAPGFRPLQFRLFNAEGQLIAHWASCEGPRKKYGVLDTFPPKNIRLPLDPNITLHSEFAATDSSIKVATYKPGYSMFIYTQIWSGKFSKWISKDLIKYSRLHNVANIYVLSTDYR